MDTPDLHTLLEELHTHTRAVERHIGLIRLFAWIRGHDEAPEAALQRIDLLLDVLSVRPATAAMLHAWWAHMLDTVDASTLLSDYGFGSRNAFLSELVERLNRKVLPATPETHDASELFALVLRDPRDARWIAALPEPTRKALAQLLSVPAQPHLVPVGARPLSVWQHALLNAMTFCTSQIQAAGFSQEMRLRMRRPVRDDSPFHPLSADLDAVKHAWLYQHDTQAVVQRFQSQLEACRQAAASVYVHLDAHGISVDLVFRLRQLRERILRVRALLDCLLEDERHKDSVRLLSHLANVGQEQRSVAALIASNSSLLAAKVTDRSSETGEHYITRSRAEYRAMLRHAAGGGALTALTTLMKFGIMALGLSAFWLGFWSGAMYAASFVLIQLLHCTLATKQPAMTAPAMAAKVKDISDSQALQAFVDEVSHLVRSQVAAIIGNVALVLPTVVALCLLLALWTQAPLLTPEKAHYVLDSLSLAGPSVLFAAFTGVLLFASSIIAGWVENWFVLHRLDSAIRYNPRITGWLGSARAHRWAHFMRNNISGLASNISLGFMLGLVPAILSFLGLGLDVRHVTLSAGQIGAACASLGWQVLHTPALWWALACIPLIGLFNVSVSFYLAFRVALQAHNVSGIDRARIRSAITQRLRQTPLDFLRPTKE